MAAALSKVYRYVPIDCDTDISGDLVELSLDQVTWTTATHAAPSSAAQAQYLAAFPIVVGSRYWVRVLAGPGLPIDPGYGRTILHGRITDSPEVPYLSWVLDVPAD